MFCKLGFKSEWRAKDYFIFQVINRGKLTLFLIFIGGYVFEAVLFSTGYFFYKSQISGVSRYSDALYFSFITQSTIGYGDVNLLTSPVVVRLMSSIQTMLFFVWLAFVPSIIVIRFANPGAQSFLFSDKLIFVPCQKSFRTRFVNLSRLTAHHINFDVRIPIMVYDVEPNRRNYKVKLNNTSFHPARVQTIRILRTKTIGSDLDFNKLDSENGNTIVLKPSNIKLDSEIYVYAYMRYLSEVVIETSYSYEKIFCGTPYPATKDGKNIWENFDKFKNIEKNYCLVECSYRGECIIQKKHLSTSI